MVLGATTATLVFLPALSVAAVAYDLVRLRVRLPSLRALLFVTQYMINDSAEILIAPVYWVRAGLGTKLDTPASIVRHERIQRWSIDVLARRAEDLLGITVATDAGTDAALESGPLIVLCRHVSLLDASLPSLLLQTRGFHVRGVIMAEMLADPGFDLLYGRLGSVFIPRDRGPEARQAVVGLGAGLTERTAAVIFPEGRLFRPDLLHASLERLATKEPDRARRLAGLRHVLPPRPGGVGALLDAAPHADVAVIAHVGLDSYPRFADLAREVPLDHPVRVTAWRIPRSAIPTAPAERTEWLDDQWQKVDEWVRRELASSPLLAG